MSTSPAASGNQDKTVAVLSYITLIGLIVAIVINKDDKKNALGSFHLRQSLGLIIAIVALGVVGTIVLMIVAAVAVSLAKIVGIVFYVLCLGWFVLWVLGLVGAIQGKLNPVPVIGAPIQGMLKNLFN